MSLPSTDRATPLPKLVLMPHPKWEHAVGLAFSSEAASTWAEQLRDWSGSHAIWWELPEVDVGGAVTRWRILCKLREGGAADCRCLLAHPEPSEWVLTLAWTPEVWRAWGDRLAAMALPLAAEGHSTPESLPALLLDLSQPPLTRLSNATVSWWRG